ncbi:MAG: putative phage abortive infection protein [Paludibacteraceae bacterium]|nr:putative phage abortive infection protein [Paludibacteraceae bacterium]
MKPLKENFCVLIIAVLLLLVLFYFGVSCFIPKEDRGAFGDMFGALNALFSGLAFAGMIVALNLQRKEFELQRKELKNSTEALEAQKKEMEKQAKELEGQKVVMDRQSEMMSTQTTCMANQLYSSNIQHVEGTIFNMLTQLRHIESGFSEVTLDPYTVNPNDPAVQNTRIVNGFEAADVWWEKYKNQIMQIDKAYFYPKIKHYFTHLYQIFKYIDESDLLSDPDEDKERWKRYKYSCIVRDGLSVSELKLMYCNNLLNEFEEFKMLSEKYALFNRLRYEFREMEKKGSYRNSAYDDSQILK